MRCRICGCTYEDACPAGCGWAPGQGNLCSVCAVFKLELAEYIGSAHDVTKASLARLLVEVVGETDAVRRVLEEISARKPHKREKR